MSTSFDSDKYFSAGEWKVAASSTSSHYEKLGFSSGDTLSDKQVIEAFHLREDWWTQKDKIARRGQAHPVVKAVGPYIQDAIKNLLEAKSILSDPVRKAQYDKKLKDEVARKAEEELIKYIHFCLPDGISPEEKRNIFNWADTSNIDRARAEEILLDEMNKAGVKFTDGGATPDSPSLPLPLNKKTHYEILGIPEDADYAQIKDAYDREKKKYYDDRDKAKASARFYVVSEAWDCLKDQQKRREYDEKQRQPKTDAGTGTPKLVVECKSDYTFSDIRRGAAIDAVTIVIRNPDGGLLQGTIKSDVPWLEPDRNKILEKHEQELYVNILTSKIPANTYDAIGNITIYSNGGSPYSIPFRVILEGLEIAVDRFRKTYVPLIAACAGFIGSLSSSPVSYFFFGAMIVGAISYASAELIVKYLFNEGIDIFKMPSVVIQGAAVAVPILAIMVHSGDNAAVRHYDNPISDPARASAPAPDTTSINITKAVVAAGADTNNVAFGIDTSFSPGNKTLHYNITYDGGIANQTVFFFKWFKSGNLISESQFTLQYPSGWVDSKLNYDFQPGEYKVEASVAGRLVNTSSFIIVETPAAAPASNPATAPDISSINITKAVVAAGVDTNNVPFGIDTSFSPGNKTLHYNLSYNGGIANRTVFFFKWFKAGTLINEYQFTLQHPSGWVDDTFTYDFQPGQYEVQLHVNGKQLDSTSFNVRYDEQQLPQQKKIKKVKKAKQQLQEEINPSGLQNEEQQSQQMNVKKQSQQRFDASGL